MNTSERKAGNIYYFLRYLTDFSMPRGITDRLNKLQETITELHNLRIRYDRLGRDLNCFETDRRYYKRISYDAPFTSYLPKKINSQLDLLRRIGEPGEIISFPDKREAHSIQAVSGQLASTPKDK